MTMESGPRISLVIVITFKQLPKATKCSDHCTFCLIAHTEKTEERILKGLKCKLRLSLEKISLDLEEEKELEM
jgi:hypothetical protein